MGRKLKLSNFKCPKCNKYLWKNGRTLGTNLIFHMCVKGGCGESYWINVVERIDTYGYKYE